MKKKLVTFFLPIPLLIPLFSPNIAIAAPCETKVCVQVVTDPTTNQIVITAMQNKPGSTAKPKPKPASTRKYTPRPYTPRPYTPRPSTPRPKVTKKPVPKVVAAVSLSDRLTQLLPQRNIFYAPKTGSVVQVPMYFWTDATTQFQTTSMILGINVGVTLMPLFTWNFGDGTLFSTTSPSAPYPNSTISHTYTKAGTYKVSLTISWSGTWSAESNTYPVLGGNIVQNYSSTFVVSNAPTKFVK